MLAVLSLLVVLGLSMIVTRVASVALVHTGLGRQAARFQARSAFAGVGFTTSEAESIVSHPLRRRIVSWLMLAGNVGIVTATSSLLVSTVGLGTDTGTNEMRQLTLLLAGIGALWLFSSSAFIDRHLCRAISWALGRFSDIDARDYARLLHVRNDFGVTELRVQEGDWLARRELRQLKLAREGTLILGIECPGGEFIGAPSAETEIRPGDTLILYGRTPRIAELDRRGAGNAGDETHDAASVEQERLAAEARVRAGR